MTAGIIDRGFILVTNGYPRCKRQSPISKPLIPSSGVRSSMELPEDWRRRRYRSLQERVPERPTPSSIGSPI